MVNPSKIHMRIKSRMYVAADANDGEVEDFETGAKEGEKKLVDRLVMDDEFDSTPNEIWPGDYEEGWGDEFYNSEFDKQLRG